MPELRRIGEDGEKESDRVKAIVALGQFAIGAAKGVDRDVVLAVIQDLAAIVRENVHDDAVMDSIHEGWRRVVRERLAAR